MTETTETVRQPCPKCDCWNTHAAGCSTPEAEVDQLRSQVATLTAERGTLQRRIESMQEAWRAYGEQGAEIREGLKAERDAALQRAERIEAEAAAMREALKVVSCCNHHPHCAQQDGCHIEDAIAPALSGDAGKALLDRLAAWKELAQAWENGYTVPIGQVDLKAAEDRIDTARAALKGAL